MVIRKGGGEVIMTNIIKAIRVYNGYSQDDVAKGIEMSKRTYFTKENNPKLFTVGELEKLASFLKVDKEIFFKNKMTILDIIN